MRGRARAAKEGSAVDYTFMRSVSQLANRSRPSCPVAPRRTSMKCAMHRWVPVLALALAAACAHQSDVSRESTQTDYGVSMSRVNLWREAVFPFKRPVQMKPHGPVAHNHPA